jgi:maltooligosyltrehalose trehalohydrolase
MKVRTHLARTAKYRLGARPLGNSSCAFGVWAPRAREVEVRLGESGRYEPLEASEDGFFSGTLTEVEPGTPYMFRLNRELERPDPASRLQTEGVHGASRVVDLDFAWRDAAWRGIPLRKYVIYELHVGTFSRRGTFEGVVPELARLRELGVTAIEIMPVAQFPGARNWGYDGVYPFAVQDSYGGPAALQRLIDECHRAGLAVVLDVVYNHLGPEGNYLADFGPYFTDMYRTPWGRSLNFDGPESEGVRRFFIENALQWVEDFHIDALRLDAVHAIIDRSAKPFIEELGEAVHQRAEELGRHVYLIAESDLNDPRMVRSPDLGGNGLDSMWCDDFHHALHVLLSGEKTGYYADFGKLEDLAHAFRSGMSQPGEFSAFRKRRHGRPGPDLKPEQHVVCTQNHDQIGNRLLGERSSALMGFEQLKLAAGVLCLAPFVPLLFMGEEYGETAPFQYFVSHGDTELLEAIRRGRKEEFASFGWEEQAPDPGALETFQRCVLNPELRNSGQHALLHRLYQTLLDLRSRLLPTAADETVAFEAQRVLLAQRDRRAWMAFCFAEQAQKITLPVPLGTWYQLANSADVSWNGPGTGLASHVESSGAVELVLQPYSFVCYGREKLGSPACKSSPISQPAPVQPPRSSAPRKS